MNYDNFTYDKLGYSYERHAIRVSNMIHGHCLALQLSNYYACPFTLWSQGRSIKRAPVLKLYCK